MKLTIQYTKNEIQGEIVEFHTSRYSAEKSAYSHGVKLGEAADITHLSIVNVPKHVEVVESLPVGRDNKYSEVK